MSQVAFAADPGPLAAAESTSSAVSWSAVLAGAFVAAATSFILMSLGAGMGLSAMSPWPSGGASARVAAPMALVWVILVQAASCALGGYLAGRLRTKWVSVHTHEVYFRDTAHGFLVWAVGLVISVFFLSSVGLSLAKDAAVASSDGRRDYYVDALFRSPQPSAENPAADAALRDETRAILAKAVAQTAMEPRDQSYLSGVIAARTGLTAAQAQQRLDETLASARQALETSRKAVAHSLYWLFAAFLIGAFCASFSATIGGRQRDRLDAA